MTTATRLARLLERRLDAAPTVHGGYDYGNTTTVFALADTVVQIPSYAVEGDLARLLRTRLGGGGSSGLKSNEYAITYQGRDYFIGDLAQSQARNPTTHAGLPDRYTRLPARLMLLAAAALALPDTPTAVLTLATGIPVATYRDAQHIESAIPDHLRGVHEYTLHTATGTESRVLHVSTVDVFMEGLPAALVHGPVDVPFGFIDIGGYTTDVGQVSASGEVVTLKTDSFADMGSYAMARELRTALALGPEGFEAAEHACYAAVCGYIANPSSVHAVYVRGRKHAIPAAAISQAIRSVVQSIEVALARLWGDEPGSDLACVLLFGGVANTTEAVPRVATDVQRLPNAHSVNAQACATLAMLKDS